MAKWQQQFEHPLWVRMGEEAKHNGGMDFLMLWRMKTVGHSDLRCGGQAPDPQPNP